MVYDNDIVMNTKILEGDLGSGLLERTEVLISAGNS